MPLADTSGPSSMFKLGTHLQACPPLSFVEIDQFAEMTFLFSLSPLSHFSSCPVLQMLKFSNLSLEDGRTLLIPLVFSNSVTEK